MSDTTASLGRKIASAGDLQSVVRTMKALAASSIVQYEHSVRALSHYARTVELGLRVSLRGAGTRPPSRPSDVVHAGVVVFGSDQGLVGRFNDKVAEHAMATLATLPGSPRVWAVGERVHARLEDEGVLLAGIFPVPSSVQAITPLVGQILVEHERDQDRVEDSSLHLFYNRPAPDAVYAPVHQRLLPLDDAWHQALAALPWPTPRLPEVIGDDSTTLGALVREHLFVSLFRACAESLASENASRLAAMERADRNIGELLEDMNARFHRLRQSAIDDELFDVTAGYEALSG